MKILKSYFNGLGKSFKLIKMSFIIYLFTLIVALIFVFPFRSALIDVTGSNSLSLRPLFRDFDYTIYKGFLFQHKDFIALVSKQFFWFGLFYFISSIFLAGGILSIIHKKEKVTIKNFISGCGEYFFRFFRLSIIILILQIIIIALIFIPTQHTIENLYSTAKSEVTLFTVAVIGIIVAALFVVLFLIISDYTKIFIVKNDSKKVFKSFWNGIKFSIKHLFSTYTLYILLTIVPIVITIMYFFADSEIGMISTKRILVMLIFQQLFIWFRVFTKIWFLSSEYNFYSFFFVPNIKEEKQALLEEKEEWDFDVLNEK